MAVLYIRRYNIIQVRTCLIFLLLWLSLPAVAQRYHSVAFYVCAHQDDWQLFMGASAYNDILPHDDEKKEVRTKKVVFIYTTAGNLNDDDDRRSCDCHQPGDTAKYPYWRVRERGARSSVHLAACRPGGYGSSGDIHPYQTVSLGGHRMARYEFRNTVSYFLRTKSVAFGAWGNTSDAMVGTVDTSTTYRSREDFTNTLYAIFRNEVSRDANKLNASFHFPDTDETINPEDHQDHRITGRCALSAARQLSSDFDLCFPIALHVDYHTKNLPANIEGTGAQHEAALTAVYCMALLDYNAWPEWGDLYAQWTSRNYFRVVSSCER